MTDWTVELTCFEVYIAAQVGVSRRTSSWKKEISDEGTGATTKERWMREVEGACAELAVARRFGKFWDMNSMRFAMPDVDDWKVRWTEHEHGGLLIHPWEDVTASDVYILVTGWAPEYRLRGWMRISEAGTPEYHEENLANRGPCWLVPQGELYSMETLPGAP